MLKLLRRARPSSLPRVPDGDRIYAIGDVHGCVDAFRRLLEKIDRDDAARGGAATRLILLGDLVDRGPDSRAVVDMAMELAATRESILLKGNHEEILLRSAQGHRASLQMFHRVGGRETLLSYGVSPEAYDAASIDELAALIEAAVPADHLTFLDAGQDHVVALDYAFVHAGVRPGVSLAEQSPADLRWIRDAFLSHRQPHDHVIVHGHSISAEPDIRANRIGIDTGAYAGGPLTAIGLEADQRWFIDA